MSETKVVHGGGIGVFSLLGVLFVGLKLTGYISWSWWWVTAPFWGGLAVCVAILLVALALAEDYQTYYYSLASVGS